MIPHWHGYLIDIVLVLVGLTAFALFIFLTSGDISRPKTTIQKVIGWAILAALVVGLAYVGQYDPEIAALKLCLFAPDEMVHRPGLLTRRLRREATRGRH